MCDNYVVALFIWMLYTECVSLNEFILAGKGLKAGLQRGLEVAWLRVFYPLDGAGRR